MFPDLPPKKLAKFVFFLPKKLWIWEVFIYISIMKNDDFWGRVKLLLKAHKITQKKFSEHILIPISTLTGWIHYDRIPDTETVYRMAILLGVTSNFLLGGEEKDIAERRLSELAAREALFKIRELAELILKETGKVKLIGKGKRSGSNVLPLVS